MPFNYVDVALLAVVGIFSLRGLLRGFVGEVAGLVGLLVGLVLARMFAPQCDDRSSDLCHGIHRTHVGTGGPGSGLGRFTVGRNARHQPPGSDRAKDYPYRLGGMA